MTKFALNSLDMKLYLSLLLFLSDCSLQRYTFLCQSRSHTHIHTHTPADSSPFFCCVEWSFPFAVKSMWKLDRTQFENTSGQVKAT